MRAGVPLTLTLSPKGRGKGACVMDAALIERSASWRQVSGEAPLPLPAGERVGVRGSTRPMRQNRFQTQIARRLRRDMTDCERVLWFALRDRRLNGLKFRRQVPLGPFVADFFCAECHLILEADGAQHDPAFDATRDAHLAALGYRTLRVSNHDIRTNLTGVLARIAEEAAR